jgi:signal transduction histidine kinase
LIRDCLDHVAAEAEARRVGIVQSLPSGLPRIDGDEVLLRRAFCALFEHAVLAMPEGGRLSVRAWQDHDALIVTLKHRMEPFSDDDLEQFFLPRFSGKPGRTVLDLPLAKIIIHRHGGKIDVNHEADGTLSVRVELPAPAWVHPTPR